jgi:hypothetical protein
MHTQLVQDLFNQLGVKYKKSMNYGEKQTQVNGVKGDVIGDGIVLNPYPYLADVFTITDPVHTKSILYFGKDTSAYAGFRYDNGSGQRLVYYNMNFVFENFTDEEQAVLGTLVTRSMDFLLNGVDAAPEISSPAFTLEQNYPNPVTSQTKIGYTLSERSPVTLTVHDLLGREVSRLVNATQDAGTYTVNFDGSNLPSGSYIYTLNACGKTVEKTMTVTK